MIRILLGILLLSVSVACTATPATNVTTFSWVPPATMINGDTIAPGYLAGFKVYCNITAGDYTNFDIVTNPAITAISMAGLVTVDGLYICGVTAYGVDMQESMLSNTIWILSLDGIFYRNGLSAPGVFSVQ